MVLCRVDCITRRMYWFRAPTSQNTRTVCKQCPNPQRLFLFFFFFFIFLFYPVLITSDYDLLIRFPFRQYPTALSPFLPRRPASINDSPEPIGLSHTTKHPFTHIRFVLTISSCSFASFPRTGPELIISSYVFERHYRKKLLIIYSCSFLDFEAMEQWTIIRSPERHDPQQIRSASPWLLR